MPKPRVTVLGTCRVYDPFEILARRGVVELATTGVYGFTHYTKETLQQLRVMHGELSIPFELKPYITHKKLRAGAGGNLATPENHLTETDLLVVEISSLKEISYGGLYLQINRLRNELVGGREPLQRWWKRLYDKEAERGPQRQSRDEFLSSDLSPLERNLVAGIEVQRQTAASMRADMEAIRAYFGGPILWVSHFDTKALKSGAEIPLRKQLVSAVEAGARSLGQPFFNPRQDIEEFGLTEALEDMAHYKPEFQAELASRFERMLPELLTSDSAASSSSTRSPNELPSGS
jgi:hypothetical protein